MYKNTMKPIDLATPVRNRYFYGKLLDVAHFTMETDYLNGKRWLLNRLVTSYGVVCGLDVWLSDDGRGLYVGPGLGIDGYGRELIVPRESGPYIIPDDIWEEDEDKEAVRHRDKERQHEHEQEETPAQAHDLHVVLCYHECETGPTPILNGECDGESTCAAGTIEERFRVELRPGQSPPISLWDCHIPDAITSGKLDYEVLVRWVTNLCPEMPDDPCIPLANVRVWIDDDKPYCNPEDVDINVREIAMSNETLFYLLMSMLFEATPRRRRG